MLIADLKYVDLLNDDVCPEGGFLSSFSLPSSLFGSTSPSALAFTNSSTQAFGPNFAIAGSSNATHAVSTPFFALAFSTSTSIAIAG
ncbi:MAG: hypothetical protein AAGA75_10075 [Cyanobacteria bacterium P01_E01_bin.6]